jgi:hypothetical protein
MGARILRWLQQRRKRQRLLFQCIAVDRLILLRDSRTAGQLDPSPSRAGFSRKHGRQGYA